MQVGTIVVLNWKQSSNSSQVTHHTEFWSYLLSFTMDPAQLTYQQALRCHQAYLHMAHLFSLFIRVIIFNVAAIICVQYLKQPWHTSMLTGQMWVLELLAGHPECIHTQLEIHSHVFYAIIDELHSLGYTDSKFVTLEEQLAIFLYCSVTGLMVM